MMTNLDNYLAESAQFIQSKAVDVYQSLYEIGERLQDVRDVLKADGYYMDWLNNVGISYDQAMFWINVYKRGEQFIDAGGQITTRSLRLLVAPSTSDEARDEVAMMLASSQPIDEGIVTLVTRAPQYLYQSYQNGYIARDKAIETTKLLMSQKMSPEARNVCLQYNVHDPAMVAYIDRKCKEGSETFFDIAENGRLNMAEGGVHISHATQANIEQYNQEIKAVRIAESQAQQDYVWEGLMMTVNFVDGRLVLSEFVDGMPIGLSQFEDGQLVNIKIKVRRDDDN